ncbi:MAG TPA: beta-propeller domain-containing protein [Vicinamibacteria bacterium]
MSSRGRRLLPLLLLLPLPACDDSRREGIRDDVTINRFRSCADVLDHVQDAAVSEMNADIDEILRYSRSFEGVGVAPPLAVPAPTAAPTDGQRSGAQDFTTTNVQERGVDEPDFVKNDGSRIFLLHDRRLASFQAWPPEQTRLVAAPELEGFPREMFLAGNTVVVFSRVNMKQAYQRAGLPWPRPQVGAGTGAGRVVRPCFEGACYEGDDGTKVTVLDVSGPEPRPLHESYHEGYTVTARRTGSAVRVVFSGALHRPLLQYYPDRPVDWRNPNAVRAAYEELRGRNRKLIQGTKLEDWLPTVLQGSPGGPLRAVSLPCGSFQAVDAPVRLGLTDVATLRLDRAGDGIEPSLLLHDTSEAYASTDSLYLTTPHYWRVPGGIWPGMQTHTYLHRFDLRGAGEVRHLASGGVAGDVLNQFSLDEERGFLRVATVSQRWETPERPVSTNHVSVFSTEGGRLTLVGETEPLAAGERIFSARFEGSRGYLVTFRRIDPFFTLDLREARQPRVVGELHVPGFSTYLHPLGNDDVLAIGTDVTEQGRVNGLQLQIFDVSDMSNPRQRHKVVLGGPWASSEAAQNHKAFNYFAARSLLAIPLSDYNVSARRYQFRSSLEVMRVTAAQGFTAVGSIDHGDLVDPEPYRGYPWGWTPAVRRGVMMDDFVYSISYGGLKVHSLANLGQPLVSIPLPEPLPWLDVVTR